MNIHIDIDSLRQAVADSVMQEIQNNGDIYRTILSEQQQTYSAIIYVWISITTLIIGGTLLYNFYFANRKIEDEVKKLKEIFKKDLELIITNQFDKIKITLKKDIDGLNSKIKDSFNKNKTEIEAKFAFNEAESSRSFGNSAMDNGAFWPAVFQYAYAIRRYNEGKHADMVTLCLAEMIACLKEDECRTLYSLDLTQDKLNVMDGVIQNISSLSDYLKKDKDIAISLLKEFKKL